MHEEVFEEFSARSDINFNLFFSYFIVSYMVTFMKALTFLEIKRK